MVKILKFVNHHIIILILLFSLLGNVLVNFKTAVNNLSYPFSVLAGLEDENLARSIMVLHGQSLYPPLIDYPFVVTLYPPVYFYLGAIFVKIFGPTLFAGRLLSFLCSLGVCVFIFLITKFYTKKIIWGIIAASFFILTGYLASWGQMFKNDITGVFFGFAGIYLFLRLENTKKYLFSVPFLLLAVFTKQTFITAPCAVFFYLLFSGRKYWPKLKEFTLYMGIFFIFIFLLLIFSTHGQYFIDTILVPRVIPWNFNLYLSYWIGSQGAFYSYGIFFILSFSYIFYEKIYYQRFSLISSYLLFSILARIDMGIEGSSINYFMETIALVGITASLFLHEIVISKKPYITNNKYWPKSLFIILLVLTFWLMTLQTPKIPFSVLFLLFLFLFGFWIARNIILKLKQIDLYRNIDIEFLLKSMIFSLFTVWAWMKYTNLSGSKIISLVFFTIIITYLIKYSIFSRNKIALLTLISLNLLSLLLLWKFSFPEIIKTYISAVKPASNLSPHQLKLETMIKESKGRVLLDSEVFLAIKNNRDIEYIPIGLKLRRQAGFWDVEKSLLFKDIGKQKFRYFIKSQGWTDPLIFYQIYRYYELTNNLDTGSFFYEIFEPSNKKYLPIVNKIRKSLDDLEAKFPTETIIFPQKYDENTYFLGLTYANDTVYGNTFHSIVKYPGFLGLYRPLHSNNPNSTIRVKMSSINDIEKFANEIFGKKKYPYRVLK